MKYVIIDSGHNERTAGKRSFDGTLREYKFNLDVSKRLSEILRKHGIKTMILQTEFADSKADVNGRVNVANKEKPDIFVSMHANAFGTTWNDANGYEIFCFGTDKNSEGYKLAEAVHDEVIKAIGLKDRGIKDGKHLGVIRGTNMPAVLNEFGFYTNKAELALMQTDDFRQKCAEGTAKGILKYFGMPYIQKEEKPAVNEYRQAVKNRFGFEDSTLDYLEAYKYGADLLKKLATKG